jgi:hypothetical protein
LSLPTRANGDVVEVQIGASVLLLDQRAVHPGAYHCAINIPADRFGQAKVWLQQRVAPLGRDGQDEFDLAAP